MFKRTRSRPLNARSLLSHKKRTQKPRKPNPTPLIRALPPWCHPEFRIFLADYGTYVDHRISTLRQMISILPNPGYVRELEGWCFVKKTLNHMEWVGGVRDDT